MDNKLKSPIDFYSNNRWVMKNLAEKTRDTANLIVGKWWLASSNNNLNKDPSFTKGPFVTGSELAHDSIDWIDPKNEFDIDKSKDKKIPSYIKIYFPSYHVRRARMIKGKFDKKEFIRRKKC